MDIFQSYYTSDKGWLDPLPNLDSPQTLVLVFGHADFLTRLDPFNEINKQYPNSVITGCSTPAGILGNRVEEQGLVISVTRFCDTRLSCTAFEKRHEENSTELGSRVASEVQEESLVAVLTFADGTVVNGSQYMEGVSHVVASKVIVTGGLATDSGEQTQSWVLKRGRPRKAVASAIGFYGNSVTFLSRKGSGWKPFGVKRTVTKVEKEVLYELDGKPALKLYKNYLGEAANDLPRSGLLHPLAILSGNPEDQVVRSIMGIDEERQSISFAGDIPHGVSAQLMYGTLENLIEGAEEAVDNLPRIHTHSQGVLSIITSCIGRLLVLNDDVELEVDAVLKKLNQSAQGTQQVGFYSAGEFATLSEGVCALHNETLTLTVIYEQ